ncbi:type II toxin-antitoxin system RelE/ParE family toxin [Nostoc sphaeroides CHAB 2801]|uniref:type II toxin-antitoxin system RelE/ParE family toxin n=1 Tax=Nostoc sphaeroides TaxID=446679 RepID=UPI001E2E6B82|nr:type II toxin-antitoxin system RelE/ParE family toxin [Nostoc sphaeroides]MCC5629098.1 type II toxin-antitoxin system RelE/ParE family toxin [Nostoc sphaeroides CHAB 2801]
MYKVFLSVLYLLAILGCSQVIDSALIVEDIRLPGYDLHELKGDRKGTWSIKVSANWRITFKFEDGDAYDVNLEDYH